MGKRLIQSVSYVALLAALVWTGAAAAKTELTVYSAYENDDLKTYKTAFEKSNPDIVINWVRDSTGVVTAKLIAEKDNPRADVVWGLAVTSVGVLKSQNLIHPYAPKGLEKLGKKFKDRANPPYWFGNSVWLGAIIFNTVEAELLKLPKPESWQDLTKPVYKGQVVMPNPASSGTGFFDVSAWLQIFGEEKGWEFMDRLHENIARYTHSGSSPAKLAGKGEYVIGISFGLRGARIKAQGAPIELIFPTEALGWDMNAFAIIKGTKNLAAAKKLADWAASEEAMRVYGATRSVVAISGMAKPIAGFPPKPEERLMNNDFDWASENRGRILKEWIRRYDSKSDPKKKKK
jgi:iron(III) transport system substrate-binding protein